MRYIIPKSVIMGVLQGKRQQGTSAIYSDATVNASLGICSLSFRLCYSHTPLPKKGDRWCHLRWRHSQAHVATHASLPTDTGRRVPLIPNDATITRGSSPASKRNKWSRLLSLLPAPLLLLPAAALLHLRAALRARTERLKGSVRTRCLPGHQRLLYHATTETRVEESRRDPAAAGTAAAQGEAPLTMMITRRMKIANTSWKRSRACLTWSRSPWIARSTITCAPSGSPLALES